MKLICLGNQKTHSIISRSYNTDVSYIPSKYQICLEIDDGFLCQNTLTGELIFLTPDEYTLFESKGVKDGELFSLLVKHGFLVPEGLDEARNVEQMRKILQVEKENRKIITFYNILPTTGCNARCFYCYEYGIKKVVMSRETAEKVVSFIAAHHGGEKVRLAWFGGEPTLGIECIDYICKRMGELQIFYESEMTSNAYLFDAELVKKAKELWHMQSIQITLDGTEETYNRIKAYVNITDNAYLRVIRNIRYFLDEGINVKIRLNMDVYNAVELDKLADELHGLFGGQELLSVYVHLLMENEGEKPLSHNEDEWEELYGRYVKLKEKLEGYGWSQIGEFVVPSLQLYSCMADHPDAIQITPDGILGKCEDCIYTHVVGNLDEGVTDPEKVKWWKERELYEGCGECVLFPSCLKLLKHCSTRPKECPKEEKDRRIRACLDMMVKAYRDNNQL